METSPYISKRETKRREEKKKKKKKDVRVLERERHGYVRLRDGLGGGGVRR